MRHLVRSDLILALMLGSLGGTVVGVTHASAAVAYLLGLVIVAVGVARIAGPELVRLRREKHGSSPP
jgi:hypothetical protein